MFASIINIQPQCQVLAGMHSGMLDIKFNIPTQKCSASCTCNVANCIINPSRSSLLVIEKFY